MKKYPRTFHLSFSPEIHSDDKTIYPEYENDILNSEIVITIKMDGGNCCIKPKEGVFARTHTTETSCQSFNYIKNIHFYSKMHILNQDYWYFGENMYAIHSIEYNGLEDYFYVFNIYDTKNKIWLSWEDLNKEVERCEFKIVHSIFKGKSNPKEIKKMLEKEINNSFFGGEVEGYVIRKLDSFKNDDFAKNIVKYVRKGHVQTDEHWSKNWKAASLNKENK